MSNSFKTPERPILNTYTWCRAPPRKLNPLNVLSPDRAQTDTPVPVHLNFDLPSSPQKRLSPLNVKRTSAHEAFLQMREPLPHQGKSKE